MDRTLYNDGIEVTQAQLQNTENTKSYHIRQRFVDGIQTGVASGLEVSVNVSQSELLNIAPGHGYTPSGELIEVMSTIVGQPLVIANADNIVGLVYTEIEEANAPHETDGTSRATRAVRAFRVSVLSRDDFNGLPETSANLALDAKDRFMTVAVVTAGDTLSTPIAPGDITAPDLVATSILTIDQPTNITGVTVVSVSGGTVPTELAGVPVQATLNYVASATPTLAYQAPGDSAGLGATVPIAANGEYTLISGDTVSSAVVNVALALLPTSNTSDLLTVSEYYGSSQDPTATSARDKAHRALVDAAPVDVNPHGIRTSTLLDVIAGYMGLPNTLVLGTDLFGTTAKALTPRVVGMHNTSGRTLLFESGQQQSPTASALSTLRIYRGTGYLGANLFELVVNASWDGVNWNRDDSGLDAGRLTIDARGRWLYHTRAGTSGDTWLDPAWDATQLDMANSLRLGLGLLGALDDQEVPRIVTDRSAIASGTKTLVWQMGIFGGGIAARVYRTASTGDGISEPIEISINAVWDANPSPGSWSRDVDDVSSAKVVIGSGAVQVAHQKASDPDTWVDDFSGSGWVRKVAHINLDNSFLTLQNGRLSFSNTGANSNPANTTGITNTILAKNTPKAWGTVACGGAPTMSNGFNAYPLTNANDEITIALVSGMYDTNYTVTMSAGEANTLFWVSDKQQEYFVVKATRTTDGAPLSIGGNDPRTLDFVVFGQQGN